MSGVPILSPTDGGPNHAWLGFAKALEQIGSVLKSQVAKIDGAKPYEYSYAGIVSTLNEVKRVCSDQGLVIAQNASLASTTDGDWATVATTLIHVDTGDWVSWAPVHLKAGTDAQKLGSAITYARRYGLTSLFSIPTEDDDGKQAVAAVVEDDEALIAMQQRSQRAAQVKQAIKRNITAESDKQALREAVFDEFGTKFLTSELDTDEDLLSFVESYLTPKDAS